MKKGQKEKEPWENYFEIKENYAYHKNYNKERSLYYNTFINPIYEVWFKDNKMSQHVSRKIAIIFAKSYYNQIERTLLGENKT